MSSSITSPSRPPSCRAAADLPARRSAVARPSATHTRACTAGRRLGRRVWATILRRSTPSGTVTAPGGPIGVDLSADPGEPEGAGGVAVAVVADQIPAALLGDHAPRLDGARGVGLGPRRAGAGTAPPAGNRWRTTGFRERPPTRADPAPRPGRRWPPGPLYRGIDVHAGGAQLEQRALGGGDQFRRLPQLRGDGYRGRLVRGQLDRRQRSRRRG